MPNLTDKELSALEDELLAEKLLIAKYKAYAQMASDPQIKSKCEQFAGKHQNHFDMLLECLN